VVIDHREHETYPEQGLFNTVTTSVKFSVSTAGQIISFNSEHTSHTPATVLLVLCSVSKARLHMRTGIGLRYLTQGHGCVSSGTESKVHL
jgi:hypothetical protein